MAVDAGNLIVVAEIVQELAPEAEICIMADDDMREGKTDNPGIEAAIRAARLVHGKVAVPNMGKRADAWDLWHEQGPDALRAALQAARPADGQSEINLLCEDHGPGQPVEDVTGYPLPPEPPPWQSNTDSIEVMRLQIEEAISAEAEVLAGRSHRIRAVGINEFLSLEFPPRSNLISPWLPSQGLVMVYAARGIGKTHFALGVSYAITCGGTFLEWRAEEPAGVLYLDGEMPAAVMQERISAIAVSSNLTPVAPFELLTPDLQQDGMPRIDTPEGQEAIDSILTDEIKLIVVDNISTLTRTKENEADGWTPVQEWALRQRAAGRSVLFVHHAGKGGQQRGTSRREDVLDTVLALKRPVDYHPDQGAVFEIYFEKARGIYGDDVKPIEARLTTDENGLISWVTRTVEAGSFDRVVQLFGEGLTQREIANELGINKSNVSRHVRRAKSEGLVVIP